MARSREILTPDVDVMTLIDELATNAVRDAHGLTLGDIAGHRADRYLTHWRALHLVAELGLRGLIRKSEVLNPIGAEVQDKTGVGVFQAAHVLACDFEVNAGDGLHSVFVSPIIRASVKTDLFGRTNVVHKLVNYVDRRCEAEGWIDTFAAAIAACLAPDANAAQIFTHKLVPGFAAAVARARSKFEGALSAEEIKRIAIKPLLAPNGQPIALRSGDFRISAKLTDPHVRSINKATVLQLFDEYRLGPAGIAPNVMASARNESIAWVDLECKWRAGHAGLP